MIHTLQYFWRSIVSFIHQVKYLSISQWDVEDKPKSQ